MKKIFNASVKIRFPDWSIPLALMGVCFLAYGFLIPKLGFYQDDWHFLYYAYTRGGAGISELMNYDAHPLGALIYTLSFKLLGFNPINWQIFSLFWRWLAVTAFWMVLHITWPSHRRTTFTAAIIYIIYPLYTMQAQSIIYFEVWVSHFLLAVSFFLTIKALKQPKNFWLFIILAIIFKLLQSVSREFTWGMELARPFLIFFALPASQGENNRRRIINSIQIFIPFFIITAAMYVWRGLIYHSPNLARSDPRLLFAILADPVGGIKSLIFKAIPDMIQIILTTWFKILDPGMFALADRQNVQILVLIILAACLLGFYLFKLDHPKTDVDSEKGHWMRQAFLFGAAALIFGMIPAYAAGYFVHLKLEPWNGRFAIGSMPGIALLGALFIEYLIDAPYKRLVIVAIIVSLGIGWQVRMINQFRSAWDAETNFYRQLLLRAPQIAAHTAFLSDQEFLGLMGDYPTSFALNTIYSSRGDQNSQEARTWLFLVATNFNGNTNELLKNIPLNAKRFSTHFSGNSSDSLVIYYEPDLGQCLWIVTPENSNTILVPQSLRDIASLTNLGLIQKNGPPAPFFPLVSSRQPDDWCSYYQRGSLAHQFKEWDKTASLWEQADKKGLHPASGIEFLPFIEAYGQLGKWEQAIILTNNSNKISRGMANNLCDTWRRLQIQTASSVERDGTIKQVFNLLKCN
jgi:hypothetical protein